MKMTMQWVGISKTISVQVLLLEWVRRQVSLCVNLCCVFECKVESVAPITHRELTTWKAHATLIFILNLAAIALLVAIHLVHASLIVVKVLKIPNRRPAILAQILLILWMQCSQILWWSFTYDVVIDT